MKKSESERMLFEVQLERLKIEREKAVIALDKGMLLYFVFLTIAVLGFINGYFKAKYLNILVVMGFIVLIVAIIPYVRVSRLETKKLNELEKNLKKGLRNE